jgi:hypothetical protein
MGATANRWLGLIVVNLLSASHAEDRECRQLYSIQTCLKSTTATQSELVSFEFDEVRCRLEGWSSRDPKRAVLIGQSSCADLGRSTMLPMSWDDQARALTACRKGKHCCATLTVSFTGSMAIFMAHYPQSHQTMPGRGDAALRASLPFTMTPPDPHTIRDRRP